MLIPIQKNLVKILMTKQEFGIHTGIKNLDEIIHGFRPDNLIVVGGSSSMGKTSLMTDFIIASAHETKCGVFSIEMGTKQVVDRLVFNLADLNYHRCQTKMSQSEKRRYDEAVERLMGLNDIYFSEGADTLYPDWKLKSPPKDSMEVVFEEMYNNGVRIFFIDYLQLIKWGDRAESETLRLKDITGKLHSLCLKYHVPIILLSQLTKATSDRATKKDQDPTPTISDLRDSGFIINDSDIILLLHRPEYYKKKKELDLLMDMSEDAHIIVGKQRNGPTGVVHTTFHAYSMSFRDCDTVKQNDELF